MKPIFLLGIFGFVVFTALGVYYLVPGPYKLLVFDDYYGVHIKHSIVMFGVGVVAILAGRFASNASDAT